MADENIFKVSLTPIYSSARRRVTFDVTPDIIENRNVNYKTMDPIHMPGSIHVYASTSSRTFNLSNVKLISRTTEEATKNILRLHQLRGWAMPYFGASSTLSNTQKQNRRSNFRSNLNENPNSSGSAFQDDPDHHQIYGVERLGAPPEVLFINAYSDVRTRQRRSPMNIHRVPCVMQQLSIPYPSDVDYIPTEDGIPFPTVMTIDITLVETHAPLDYNKFKLQDYRRGKLPDF